MIMANTYYEKLGRGESTGGTLFLFDGINRLMRDQESAHSLSACPPISGSS
jgi:hypothetical protein